MRATLALLLAVACTTAAAAAAVDPDPNTIRTCLPCRPEDKQQQQQQQQGPCPLVAVEQCASGELMPCGCCQACRVLLGGGQQCQSFAPRNVKCAPGLVCSGSGLCIQKT